MTKPQPLPAAAPFVPHPPGALLRCDSSYLGVLVTHDWRRLIAIVPIAAGTKIFRLVGRETPVPTRFSVQIGRGLHVDQDESHDANEAMFRYFWRFMDHSCDPTAMFRDREAFALRDIEPGDGVTFDYNTTEYEMAEPFRCRCGSPHCAGLVRGARYLTAKQRARFGDRLAVYLR